MIIFGKNTRSIPLRMVRRIHRFLPRLVCSWVRKRWISRPMREPSPLTGDPEHLEKLHQGMDAWNAWREQDRETRKGKAVPLLMGFSLRGCNLDGYDLVNANLQEAVLRGASMRDANLRGTNLIRADLRGVDLKGSWFDDRETDLRDADFRGTNLLDVLLDNADIRGVRGLVLDSTRLRNARFSPTAKDPWSILRKSYTGPRLILNYLFLVAFLVPYLVKSVGWIGVNKAETAIDTTVSRLAERVETLTDFEDVNSRVLRSFSDELAKRAPNEGNGWRRYSLWQVVIGLDRSPSYWLTAVALVLYNVLRTLLTMLVAPLRDEEERSGHSPPHRPRQELRKSRGERLMDTLVSPHELLEKVRASYGWMMWPHRVVRILFFFAFGAFVLHMTSWLSTPILLPPSL